MKEYYSFCFENEPLWDRVPEEKINCFQWEEGEPFRPDSSFKMCFVKNSGIYVRMVSDEENPRAVYTKRDEPCYEDSCLEFFFAPFGDEGYFNIEMNPNAAFLSQFGKGRENRKYIKELTDISPVVKKLPLENGWGVELFVPCSLVEKLFSRPFSAGEGNFTGCFFKCGDKTPKPHYGSFVPMGELPPGFHNPKKFAKITIREFEMESFRKLIDVCRFFGIEGDPVRYKMFTDGHINATYLMEFKHKGEARKYLVQNINTTIFKDPNSLMKNIINVTHYLRKKIKEVGGDPERETLHFLKTVNGELCLPDKQYCWRIYKFIDNSFTYDLFDDRNVFKSAGESFGRFQGLLSEYPIDNLYETIPDFHNTPKRVNALKESVQIDCAGRAEEVKAEVDFALAREDKAGKALELLKSGKIPLRVTHNDTKINNILFDEGTNKAICVIDLDTIMPGLSLYDFGDAIRFGAKTALEDEKDLSKVSISLDYYEAYVEGYLSSCARALTVDEIDNLAYSAMLMTYECGVRFLTDYLNGDTYFKIGYPEHNLVRARNQFKMVSEIEKVLPQMDEITHRVYNKIMAE